MFVNSVEHWSNGIAYMAGALSTHRGIKTVQLSMSQECRLHARVQSSLRGGNIITINSQIGESVQAFTFGVSGVNYFQFSKSTMVAGEQLEAEVRRILGTDEGTITVAQLDELREHISELAEYNRYLLYLISRRMRPNRDILVAANDYISYPPAFTPIYARIGAYLNQSLADVSREVSVELKYIQNVLNQFPFMRGVAIYIAVELSSQNATFTLIRDMNVFTSIWQIAVTNFAIE
jgi:hypothetical protein